jgi:hypothetical protein
MLNVGAMYSISFSQELVLLEHLKLLACAINIAMHEDNDYNKIVKSGG